VSRPPMSKANPSPVTNGDTTDKRTAAKPPRECPHGCEHCPVNNAAVDGGLECFECFTALRADTPDTDAWEVAL